MAPSSGLEPKTLESKSSMLPITPQGNNGSFCTLTATKLVISYAVLNYPSVFIWIIWYSL